MKTKLISIQKSGDGWTVTIQYRTGKEYSTNTYEKQIVENAQKETFTVRAGLVRRRAVRQLIEKVKIHHNLI